MKHLLRVHYISDNTGLWSQGSSDRVLALCLFSLKLLPYYLEIRILFLHFPFIYFKRVPWVLPCSRYYINCWQNNGD